MDREELLKKLTRLDFMAIDLALYLDTHSTDSEGISLYNKITASAEKLREIYEESYGPLRNFGTVNMCEHEWLWSRDPWPWEKSFNFSVE